MADNTKAAATPEGITLDIMELMQEHGADWWDTDTFVLDGEAIEFQDHRGNVFRVEVLEC